VVVDAVRSEPVSDEWHSLIHGKMQGRCPFGSHLPVMRRAEAAVQRKSGSRIPCGGNREIQVADPGRSGMFDGAKNIEDAALQPVHITLAWSEVWLRLRDAAGTEAALK
jgi:hypothetical protein